MADYTPVKDDDLATFTAAVAVTGGQLVSVTGPGAVSPSAGGDHATGVAAHDAAAGQPVSVWPLPGYVHETPVTGVVAIAAGAGIKAAAAGAVDTGTIAVLGAAGTLLGIAVTSATGPAKIRWIGT